MNYQTTLAPIHPDALAAINSGRMPLGNWLRVPFRIKQLMRLAWHAKHCHDKSPALRARDIKPWHV